MRGKFRPARWFPWRTPILISPPRGASANGSVVRVRPPRATISNYVLNGAGGRLDFCARLTDPVSGRVMEVWTTEPGVQLNTQWLRRPFHQTRRPANPPLRRLRPRDPALSRCVNHPEFPSTILRPGETYRSTTEFRFLPSPDPAMLLTVALLSFNLSAHELPRVAPLAEAALGTQPVQSPPSPTPVVPAARTISRRKAITGGLIGRIPTALTSGVTAKRIPTISSRTAG